MKILILDVETDSLNNDKKVIEIAATLYYLDQFITGQLMSITTLLPTDNNNAIAINNIHPELTKFNPDKIINKSLEIIKELIVEADICTAFNAEFDKPLVNELLGVNPQWFCSYRDIDWGYHKENFRLIDLALHLGIGVSNIHRASDDVRLLVEIFNRTDNLYEKIQDAIKLSIEPIVTIIAQVNYDDRELAKNAGFQWDKEKKLWIKEIKESKVEELKKQCQFLVSFTR